MKVNTRGVFMRVILILLLSTLMIFVQGCAKEKKQLAEETPAPTDRFDDTPPPPSGDESATSNKATLDIVSVAVMEDYALRPLNDPSDVKVELILDDFGNGRYGGSVSISYYDNGQYYASDQRAYSSENDVKYNIWFTKNGNNVWHGFFEDYFGAIVVVIDNVVDLGDGGTGDLVGGSVWYKNFGETYAPKPPMTRCWFIRRGPYDCRTFISGSDVNTTSSVNPNNGGYRKLGEFSGLSRSQAFNE